MTFFSKLVPAFAAPLLLTGCLVTPGQFESELVIQKDGAFTFSYDGEISVLGMQKLISVAAQSEEEDFEPQCFKDSGYSETVYRRQPMVQSSEDLTRECTDKEAEEQRLEKKRENEQMIGVFQALFGGIDPSTPDALKEMVERTRKQKGWEQIDHRGDGIFDVKYAISGRLDRNFVFPHFEQAKAATAFVETITRKDNKVRIEAPGFSQLDESNGMMQLGTLAAMGEKDKSEKEGFGEGDKSPLPPGFTKPNGTFKIITNAAILTNNTDEGPATAGDMKVLSWTITERTKTPPEALLELD